METYTELKEFMPNPYYDDQKQNALSKFADAVIDLPIIEIINGFNRLSFCFTLQSCYGHFIYDGQNNPHNIEPLPTKSCIEKVEYRIAYIAVCIENSTLGSELYNSFQEITAIAPDNIQFCCANWFWEKQINSYVLQVAT